MTESKSAADEKTYVMITTEQLLLKYCLRRKSY